MRGEVLEGAPFCRLGIGARQCQREIGRLECPQQSTLFAPARISPNQLVGCELTRPGCRELGQGKPRVSSCNAVVILHTEPEADTSSRSLVGFFCQRNDGHTVLDDIEMPRRVIKPGRPDHDTRGISDIDFVFRKPFFTA